MKKPELARIRLLFLDVDGVLTNGKIMLNASGEESKSFDVKDGLGIKRILEKGIEVVIISGRDSRAVDRRAEELGISHVYQGIKDKRQLCRSILGERKLEKEHACAMGDDLPDIEMFLESGVKVAVADAVEEVREDADIVTESRGGSGAVRELCDMILKEIESSVH